MSTGKPQLNVCFVGHVDSGKSTTVGHLQVLLGKIEKREMSKLSDEAAKLGKDSFKFAFSMDTLKAERERGITIENSLKKLETEKFDINLIDCPGHRDFIKNMVTGAAQADVAIIVVPCANREFESAISGGTLKDHIIITGVLGCKKAIVCVNKMDAVPAADREKRFQEVSDNLKLILKKYHPDKDPIVLPISGYMGTNLTKAGEKFEWFKGWSPKKKTDAEPIMSLEEAINSQDPPVRPFDKPLRMPIVGIHNINGVGEVYTGRVDAGEIKPNMSITIQPCNIATEVKTLEIHRQSQTVVKTGQNCGVALKSIGKDESVKIKAGHIISNAKDNPLVVTPAAEAKILITDHNGNLKVGYTPTMDISTQHVATRFAKLLEKAKVGGASKVMEVTKDPEFISKGDAVKVVIVPTKDTAFETQNEYPSLGKFGLRDCGHIVGIGSITKKITKEELIKEYNCEVNPSKKKSAATA